MPSKGRNRRTKAADNWGNPNITFPSADLTTPTVQDTETINKAAPLPAFGTAHPNSTDFPLGILTDQKSSPGDDTDTNVTQTFESLPGTVLQTTKTSQFGNQIVSTHPDKASGTLTITNATADAQKQAVSAVKSQITVSNFVTFPTQWLFGYNVDPETQIGTRILKRLNANGTQGGIAYLGTVNIVSATATNPVVLELSAPLPTMNASIPFSQQEWVTVAATGISPPIDGNSPATIIDPTHISLPFNVSAVGVVTGTVRIAAFYEREIQDYNDRQCIEIWSQIDTSTLGAAQKTWEDWIQYPWKEAIVGIDVFNDPGSSTTTPSGTFQIPTNIQYGDEYSYRSQVAVRTARYTGPTNAQKQRNYFWGPPPNNTSVLQVRTSSGEAVCRGGSQSDRTSISVQQAGVGSENTQSTSVQYNVTRIEDVITNGHVTGTLDPGGIGFGSVTLKLDASFPDAFVGGDSFLASCVVEPQRLGLYMQELVSPVVPASWPE